MSTPPVSAVEPGGALRFNELTRRWVVIAPTRGRRPIETDAHARPKREERTDGGAESARPGSEHRDRGFDPSCPFCPGNEGEVPPIEWELAGRGGAGWSIRAIPNRYPAFGELSGEAPHLPGRPAAGYQEVLVESPRHLDDLCHMSRTELERVVEGYRQRYGELCGRPGVARVALFRNRGPRAGTSLRHPHAQLVAMAFDPPDAREREAAFRKLRDALQGVCPICDPSAIEPGFRSRILHEGEHFQAWVPWAAEAPFETWIAPRRHMPDFRTLTDQESGALARLLGRITRAYRAEAGDPDYNLLLHSAGCADPAPEPLHWWIRLRPRVGTDAGLELLTGVGVNASTPDADARILRRGLGDPGNTGDPGE